jgi:hypothetical protein
MRSGIVETGTVDKGHPQKRAKGCTHLAQFLVLVVRNWYALNVMWFMSLYLKAVAGK